MDPIPSPPHTPFCGHLPLFTGDKLIQKVMAVAAEYGPIVSLTLVDEVIVVSTAELLADVLAKPHDKKLSGPLIELRAFLGDGLFTSASTEPNWAVAHEVLVPAFRRSAMTSYFEAMQEITGNLLDSWAERPTGSKVDIPEQMTRLTFDTIGLTGFGFRFDSFQRADQHPFVDAMRSALKEAMKRVAVPGVLKPLRLFANRAFTRDLAVMNDTVDTLIRQRRAEGTTHTTDLLGRMLSGVTDSGERLDDLNIRYQILTFLIAGHETTSGALSFAVHFLLQDPELMARVVAEVDAVFGDSERPSWEQVHQLKLVGRVLKEALRLWPTAPGFSVTLLEDTVVGGRWTIPAGVEILALLPSIHRDPAVWNAPERFDPDRFLPEREHARSRAAFKPFGDGKRACIGSQFAMLEATLVLGSVLHRFELRGDPSYALDVVETLTLKPGALLAELHPRR